MQDRIYLLSIAEFLEESGGEELMRQAFEKVDESRRTKAGRIRQPRAKAASLGAGLLLQLAVQEAAASPKIHNNLANLTISEILPRVETTIPLEFTYGKSGKPYLRDYPLYYFNLSHSGEYVVCVISDREIGVDIQEHRRGDVEKIAARYFSTEEILRLESCDPEQKVQAFFDLWAAKEAYGKYTGGGITESLELEVPVSQVTLETIHNIPGYSLVICKAI